MHQFFCAQAMPLPGIYVQCQALKSSCHILLAQTLPARASLIHPLCVPNEILFLHSAKLPCSHTPSVCVTGPKLSLKSSICLRIPIYQRIRAHIDHWTTGCHQVIRFLHAHAHTPRLDPTDLCEDKGLGAKKHYLFTFDRPQIHCLLLLLLINWK